MIIEKFILLMTIFIINIKKIKVKFNLYSKNEVGSKNNVFGKGTTSFLLLDFHY